MSIRHRAYKRTLDRGYASEWNDDHMIDFTDRILQSWTFATYGFTQELRTSVTGSGNAARLLYNDHFWLRLQTGTTAGSTATLDFGGSNVTHVLDLPIFTMALSFAVVEKALLGVLDASSDPWTSPRKGAFFFVDGGVLYAITGDGTAEKQTAIGSLPSKAQFKVQILSNQVKFFIDNMFEPVAIHTTNLPTAGLQPIITIKSTTSANGQIYVDAIGLERLRKK
jgi:hypothetical protein